MPIRPFPAREAVALLKGLHQIDHDLGPGRDLAYDIETRSGKSIYGLVVEMTDEDITLVDDRRNNEHNTVTFDDISKVSVLSYT